MEMAIETIHIDEHGRTACVSVRREPGDPVYAAFVVAGADLETETCYGLLRGSAPEVVVAGERHMLFRVGPSSRDRQQEEGWSEHGHCLHGQRMY